MGRDDLGSLLSCRAATLVEPGEPLDVVDVPVPRTFEPGSLLVRTSAATVCGSDVHLWEGTGRPDLADTLPCILGHEVVGRVVHIAEGAGTDSMGRPLSLGDRIVWTHGFCGRCHACVVQEEPTLCVNRRGYMTRPWTEPPRLTGGFAEYVYVFPTSGRVRVPDEVSDAAAAASSCALRTVVHAFDRLGPVVCRTVVLQGAGPLGLFATARAVTAGASAVIVVGGPAPRLDLARQWGATDVVDIAGAPDAAARIARVRELTGGRGADVVVEVSGARGAFGEGVAMVAPGGRYLVVGGVSTDLQAFDPSVLVRRQLTVIGSLSGSVKDYYHALEFMAGHRDRFRWEDMITGRFGLGDVTVALHRMRALQEIKPVIVFDRPATAGRPG